MILNMMLILTQTTEPEKILPNRLILSQFLKLFWSNVNIDNHECPCLKREILFIDYQWQVNNLIRDNSSIDTKAPEQFFLTFLILQ
jgi:hypothetical protein